MKTTLGEHLVLAGKVLHIQLNPSVPRDASKHHFKSIKTGLIPVQLSGLRREISMKLFHQYMVIFFTF